MFPGGVLGVASAELPVFEITPVGFDFPSHSAHKGRRESSCRPRPRASSMQPGDGEVEARQSPAARTSALDHPGFSAGKASSLSHQLTSLACGLSSTTKAQILWADQIRTEAAMTPHPELSQALCGVRGVWPLLLAACRACLPFPGSLGAEHPQQERAAR